MNDAGKLFLRMQFASAAELLLQGVVLLPWHFSAPSCVPVLALESQLGRKLTLPKREGFVLHV